MGIREKLQELEDPPPGCDLVDVDSLLRECGYQCFQDKWTLFYAHDEWRSFLTFPASKSTIPQRRLRQVIDEVRWHLDREGKL